MRNLLNHRLQRLFPRIVERSMRSVRTLVALACFSALLVFVGACDEGTSQPSAPEGTLEAPSFSHGADGSSTGTAHYGPIDGSGIQGVVAIRDNGSKLTVAALAMGLDPDNEAGYSSALYDQASQLQGPEACEPGKNVGIGTDHPLSLTLNQMIIGNFGTGEWVVNADGTGSLGPFETIEYVSLDRIGAISIRDLRINGGFGPDAVVACGEVTTG